MSDTEGANATKEGDDYDPHLFRNRPSPTTNWETLAHLLKGSLGTGILAMPKAFLHAGLYVGAFATIAVGVLCTYCLHVLVRTQYILCKRHKIPLMTYPESMQKALEVGPGFLRPIAPYSGFIIDFFLVVYQLGICCVYIVFMAEGIKQVVEVYEGETMSKQLYICCLLPMLFLINLIPTLKKLAPFSALANLLIAAGLGIILYYVFGTGELSTDLPAYGKAMDFPLFIGTTLFALEAVGVVLALENNMKTPKSFGTPFGVLNTGMFIVVFLYLFIGLVGYLRYGSECKDVIVKNLPQDSPMTQSVQILYVVAIFISYALNSFVPVDILWNSYIKEKLTVSEKQLFLFEYGLRFVLVIITFIVAVAKPDVGVFISLFGAFCLSALGISFPAILEMCTLWPDELGRFNWILVKDIVLFFVGLLALVIGTYTSILDMIK